MVRLSGEEGPAFFSQAEKPRQRTGRRRREGKKRVLKARIENSFCESGNLKNFLGFTW
jgi:hypothetical protein